MTIHDLSMLLYSRPQESKRVSRAQRRLALVASASTMIITPQIRGRVHEHFRSSDRIVAISEAARTCFRRVEPEQTIETRRRLGVRHEFLLFVGTVEPRKNLSTLLRAFEEVVRVRPKPLQLVIAGRKGWLVEDLFESLRHSPAAEYIIFTGYLSDEDLCALYSSCAALIYPSIYEGFGLPPLEAMACGAPVIASDIAAIKEVVGTAARLVSPESPLQLANVLVELLDSGAAQEALSTAGIKRAMEFSWERAAFAPRRLR